MLLHPVTLRRCSSCHRWAGTRNIGAQPETIEIEDEATIGVCRGGPWDGSERRARSACGRWLRWQALAPEGEPAAPAGN